MVSYEHKVKNIYLGAGTLPSWYQEVEYIESSGTQWIDTWYNPTWNTTCEIKFYVKSWSGVWIFGVDTDWLNKSYSVFRDRVFVYGTQTARQSGGTNYLLNNTLYVLEHKNDKVYLNWTLDYTFTHESFTSQYSTSIFAKKRWNNIEAYSSIKLYYMKIWDDWMLVRDFVPCYRTEDDVIWLYDKVNNVFYTNSWTWTFTKWPDV